jgi:hypothetical protein
MELLTAQSSNIPRSLTHTPPQEGNPYLENIAFASLRFSERDKHEFSLGNLSRAAEHIVDFY